MRGGASPREHAPSFMGKNAFSLACNRQRKEPLWEYLFGKHHCEINGKFTDRPSSLKETCREIVSIRMLQRKEIEKHETFQCRFRVLELAVEKLQRFCQMGSTKPESVPINFTGQHKYVTPTQLEASTYALHGSLGDIYCQR